MQVVWDNDEKSWERVQMVRKDDLLSMVKNTNNNKLVKTNGWNCAKKCKNLIQRYSELITRVNAFHAQKEKFGNKCKFGIQVSDNPRDAYLLDKLNKETQWANAMDKELAEID